MRKALNGEISGRPRSRSNLHARLEDANAACSEFGDQYASRDSSDRGSVKFA